MKNQLEKNNISKFSFFRHSAGRVNFDVKFCFRILNVNEFSFSDERNVFHTLECIVNWLTRSGFRKRIQNICFSFDFNLRSIRFKVGKVWLIWMVNHKVNIVSINLFVVAVIISAICLNNFFVFVAKYQVNSRPKLPRLFRARNISGEKIFSFCWSAFFLLLLNISRAVNFCFSVWKFRRGREIKTNDFSLLCIISMSTSFPSFQKCSLEILYLTSNRYWKHFASCWFRSFSRKDPDGSLNKLNDVSNVF